MIHLDSKSTALILIDLQKGIVPRAQAPRSGADVVANAKSAAERFRAAGCPVVLVRVGWSSDLADLPPQAVDEPIALPAGGPPPEFADLVEGLEKPGDIHVTKRHWGAFHGTALDLQMRRRGVKTLVIGGIATNFGVELTARSAWEHGYDVVIAEDLTATFTQEMHDFAIQTILPRVGRVRQAGDIALQASEQSASA